jgi:hypothetical protein
MEFFGDSPTYGRGLGGWSGAGRGQDSWYAPDGPPTWKAVLLRLAVLLGLLAVLVLLAHFVVPSVSAAGGCGGG